LSSTAVGVGGGFGDLGIWHVLCSFVAALGLLLLHIGY